VSKKLIVAMVVVGALGLVGCSHKKQAATQAASVGTVPTTVPPTAADKKFNSWNVPQAKPKKW